MTERTTRVEDWEPGDEATTWTRKHLIEMDAAFAARMAATLAQAPAGAFSAAPPPSTPSPEE